MSDLKRLLVVGGLLSLLVHWVAIDLWRATHRGSARPDQSMLTARLMPSRLPGELQRVLPTPVVHARPPPLEKNAAVKSKASDTGASHDVVVATDAIKSPASSSPALASGTNGIRAWTQVENLIAYRIALANAAGGDWHVTTGEPGRAVLKLSVNERGSVPDVRLVASSGDAIFDQAGLVWLVRAAKLAPIPDGLRGLAFDLELVVER